MKSQKVRNRSLIEKKSVNGGKDWVFWTVLNGRSIAVSFEELYYIFKFIGECEDEKYDGNFVQGKGMVFNFLREALYGEATYGELQQKYQLPR